MCRLGCIEFRYRVLSRNCTYLQFSRESWNFKLWTFRWLRVELVQNHLEIMSEVISGHLRLISLLELHAKLCGLGWTIAYKDNIA